MWIYAAIYLAQTVLPPLITALLAWLLYRLVFRRRRWTILPSLFLALALSCVPALLDRSALNRDLARYAPDEITPDRIILPSGPLLHLQESNHAGITCDLDCPFSDLPFVSQVAIDDLRRLTDEQGNPLDARLDLWSALDNPDRSQAFPFRYAFISAPVYWYATAIGVADYRKSYWPKDGKGVHMLVELPPDGILDLTTAATHYLRFNIQTDLARYLFWGIGRQTEQQPSTSQIFQDLLAISQAE